MRRSQHPWRQVGLVLALFAVALHGRKQAPSTTADAAGSDEEGSSSRGGIAHEVEKEEVCSLQVHAVEARRPAGIAGLVGSAPPPARGEAKEKQEEEEEGRRPGPPWSALAMLASRVRPLAVGVALEASRQLDRTGAAPPVQAIILAVTFILFLALATAMIALVSGVVEASPLCGGQRRNVQQLRPSPLRPPLSSRAASGFREQCQAPNGSAAQHASVSNPLACPRHILPVVMDTPQAAQEAFPQAVLPPSFHTQEPPAFVHGFTACEDTRFARRPKFDVQDAAQSPSEQYNEGSKPPPSIMQGPWRTAAFGCAEEGDRQHQPPADMLASPTIVPQLCEALVLHGRDTHLTLPMCALKSAEVGSGFSVQGPLRAEAFRVDLTEAFGGGRALRLFVPRFGNEAPWAVVQPLLEREEHRRALQVVEGLDLCSALEILDARGAFFGLLVAQRPGVWWMVHGPTSALLRLTGDATRCDGGLTVSAGLDEHVVGFASPDDEQDGAADPRERQLHLCVKPKTDPLLVLACTVAAILLF